MILGITHLAGPTLTNLLQTTLGGCATSIEFRLHVDPAELLSRCIRSIVPK